MNWKEMHIALELGLNKINSHKFNDFEPSELDHALNIAQDRFIKNKIDLFQNNQRNLDDLRTIIKREYQLELLSNRDDVFDFLLPYDYRHLLSSKSLVNYKLKCADITTDTVETDNELYSTTVEFNPTEPFSRVQLELDDDMIFDTDDYFTDIVFDIDDKFIIINLILNTLNRIESVINNAEISINTFYEYFNDRYFPNSFYFISKDIIFKDVTLNLYIDEVLINSNNTTTSINQVKIIQDDFESIKPENRLINTYDLSEKLNNPFSSTKYNSPISNIYGTVLAVYTDINKFLVNQVLLTYIKNPNQINNFLDINCELPVHTHNDIVEIAIQYLLENISSPRTNTKSNDNSLHVYKN